MACPRRAVTQFLKKKKERNTSDEATIHRS